MISELLGAGSMHAGSTKLLEEHWRNILHVKILNDFKWL